MITKNDCYLLLAEIERNGVDTSEQIDKLTESTDLPLSVIKFINDNRQLEVTQFYEYIRKSYNNKKSTLYINIMKEVDDATKAVTTLSAMATQILLFTKKLESPQMFMKHVRLSEIYQVLYNYTKTYDLTLVFKLIKLIKADIQALESTYRVKK